MIVKFRSRNPLLNFQILLGILISAGIHHGHSYMLGNNPYRRGALLDPHQKYKLEWTVDQQLDIITFNVTVRTRGWILFGMANDGGERTGRDVVIGGVSGNGQAYFSDCHTGRFNERLQTDVSQDYILESSWENDEYTYLSFSRALDTCDHQDYAVTENTITLVWAYGDNDDEDGRIPAHQGTYPIYLLDPEFAPRIIQEKFQDVPRIVERDFVSTKVWTISKSTLMSADETAYLCSIHKAPRLPRKHHIIGFQFNFADEQSRNHTHHLIVYRCKAPRGLGSSARDLFESYARSGEQQSCLAPASPVVGDMPTHYCTQPLIEWAVGGREFFIPDHVGFPFGEESDEYYMFQPHLDNPLMRTDITVTINLHFFYTGNLRPTDGGLFGIGGDVPGLPEAVLIPPQTSNMRILGHCSEDCTERILPQEGVKMVAGRLHAHMATRKMRMRHFRNNIELPWILYDDNYSNEFQQFRALRRGEVQILPGDQLTMECTYDNTWTNGTTVGGFRTRQEMCLGWLLHYNLIEDYGLCLSGPVSPAYRQRFLGITNVTYFESRLDWVAQPPSPRFLVGRTITDISDNLIEWDAEARRQLQDFHVRHPHVGSCSRLLHTRDPEDIRELLEGSDRTGELILSGDVPTRVNTENDYSGPVSYPFSARPYTVPPNSCAYINGLFKDESFNGRQETVWTKGKGWGSRTRI